MTDELVPLLPNRPPILKLNGWTVYLSVHDSAYLNQLKTFKARLKLAHPDAGGSGAKFRHVMSQRRSWQLAEATWYAAFDLLPPDGCRLGEALIHRTQALRVANRERGQKSLP